MRLDLQNEFTPTLELDLSRDSLFFGVQKKFAGSILISCFQSDIFITCVRNISRYDFTLEGD